MHILRVENKEYRQTNSGVAIGPIASAAPEDKNCRPPEAQRPSDNLYVTQKSIVLNTSRQALSR